jgi:hypothetical protein
VLLCCWHLLLALTTKEHRWILSEAAAGSCSEQWQLLLLLVPLLLWV